MATPQEDRKQEEQLAALETDVKEEPSETLESSEIVGVLQNNTKAEINHDSPNEGQSFLETADAGIRAFERLYGKALFESPSDLDKPGGVFMSTMSRVLNKESYDKIEGSFAIRSAKAKLNALVADKARKHAEKKENALLSEILNKIKSNSIILSPVESIVNDLQGAVDIESGVIKIKRKLDKAVSNIVYSLGNDAFDKLLPGIRKEWSDFLIIFDEFLDRPNSEITANELKNIFGELNFLLSGLQGTAIFKKAQIDRNSSISRNQMYLLGKKGAEKKNKTKLDELVETEKHQTKAKRTSTIAERYKTQARLNHSKSTKKRLERYRDEALKELESLESSRGALVPMKDELEKLEREKANDAERIDELQKRVALFDQARSDALEEKDNAQHKIDSLRLKREKANARNDLILARVDGYSELIVAFKSLQGALQVDEFEKFARKAKTKKIFDYFDSINVKIAEIKDKPFIHADLEISCVGYLDAFRREIESLRNASSIDHNRFIEFFKNKLNPFVEGFSQKLYILDQSLSGELKRSETELEEFEPNMKVAQLDLERSKAKVSNLDLKNENLRLDLKNSNAKLAGLESRIKSLRLDLGSSDAELAEPDSKIKSLKSNLTKLNSRLGGLKPKSESLQSDLKNLDEKLAELDSQIESLESTDLYQWILDDAFPPETENLTDTQAAKKIFETIVAEQNPDLLPKEQEQSATAILENDVQTIQTGQNYEDLPERADPETVKTVEAVNFAGIQNKLINFRYKLNDKTVQPFKNFKPDDFTTWERMEELFDTGRLDRQNGFFALAVFEYSLKGKISKQAEGLRKRLMSLLEEELGEDKGKATEAFNDQMKKIKPLVSEFLALNANPDSKLKDRKTQELSMRIKVLNEQYRLGKIEKSIYELRRKQILEEAMTNGIENRLSQNTVLSGFWNNKHSQWLRDGGYALGSYGARKAKAIGFTYLELYGRGLWGATKLAFSTAWNGVKRVPLRAVKNTLTLAATPLKGLVNLKRWVFGQKYWTPFSITKNVKEDLNGIKEFVSKKGTETFEGAKTAFKTVPVRRWSKEKWKSKKYAERTTKDTGSLASQADELEKAAEMPSVEINVSPFIDIKSYKKEKEKSNEPKSASDDNAESAAA